LTKDLAKKFNIILTFLLNSTQIKRYNKQINNIAFYMILFDVLINKHI